MKLGVLVDGEAEFRGLRPFLGRIEGPFRGVKVLKADLQPYSRAGRIVRAAKPGLLILEEKKVGLGVVLLDHEDRLECPGEWAQEIEDGIKKALPGLGIDLAVVVKHKALENWLVSDPQALSCFPKRFRSLPKKARRVICAGRADHVNAVDILRRSVVRRPYDKVADGARILRVLDPLRGGENSRSLRRLLRVVGCAVYREQSRKPVSK